MGESGTDRASLLLTLANLPEHPESVPINQLVRVPGTPLEGASDVDPFDFVRTIAVARLLMPRSHVRLSAGRQSMSDEMQALCFLAGANSIFYGEKLLTTGNPEAERDRRLFARLGLQPETLSSEGELTASTGASISTPACASASTGAAGASTPRSAALSPSS
jgi:biotin synthase